ncbi:MAG: mannosyltransferase family protein [Candidatus Baltobacteraceae bacterium]
MEAGPGAIALVVLGGLSLGFVAWYTALVHVPAAALRGDVLLWFAIPAGVIVALAGWLAYGQYFAKRGRVSLATALRNDALSWAALLIAAAGIAQPFGPSSMGRTTAAAIALFGIVKVVVAARYNRTVRETLVTFVVTRVPIVFIAELAAATIAPRPGLHIVESTNPLLAVWGRWDAVHYLEIAARGYYGTDMAFFPLYPGLIHALGRVVGNDLVAGLAISNAAFFFGLLYFYKLVEHQWGRSVALRAIFYVSIFPAAVFFSAVYTESLFFALTVASFYYIREHRWVTAGLLGGLAALTRVEGVLLFAPYVVEMVAADGVVEVRNLLDVPWRFARQVIGAALIPLGLVAYMAMLWVLRGDPLYFSHVQEHWDRHFAPPWVSLWRSISVLTHAADPTAIAGQSIELGFTLMMIGVLAFGWRRLRPSYVVYMVLSILVPLSTSSLMSTPRFALVLFPMFVVLALWGERSWVNSTIVAFSLPLLGLFTVLFANWYWVA